MKYRPLRLAFTFISITDERGSSGVSAVEPGWPSTPHGKQTAPAAAAVAARNSRRVFIGASPWQRINLGLHSGQASLLSGALALGSIPGPMVDRPHGTSQPSPRHDTLLRLPFPFPPLYLP